MVSAFTDPWRVCVAFAASWTSKVTPISRRFAPHAFAQYFLFVSDGFRKLSGRFPKVYCISMKPFHDLGLLWGKQNCGYDLFYGW